MKLKSIIFLALTSLLLFTACKSDKKHHGPRPTEFEQKMTNDDSVKVANLINQFFEYTSNKQYSDAAGMLYTVDVDHPDKEPQLLDNDQLTKMIAMLKSVPMIDYKIEYMKFNQSYNNEVMCTVTIAKGHDNIPDATTKLFFKPVNWLGGWCLCLMNSTTGDNTIIKPEERDSMGLEYETELRKREAQQATDSKTK